jgi:hypothetical protein
MIAVQTSEVNTLTAPFSLAQQSGLGLFSIVGFPSLLHIPSLADGTMETKV